MYFLQFKKEFGVSLLPVAYNNVTLGDLMFVKPFKRPISVLLNVPSHIYNLFHYQALVSRKKCLKRLSELALTPLSTTPLLEQRIIASPSLIKATKDDFLALVLLNFEEDPSVVEIAFSRLEQKEMTLKFKKRVRKLIFVPLKKKGKLIRGIF